MHLLKLNFICPTLGVHFKSAFFRIFLNLMHSLLFIGAAVGRRSSFADFIILNPVLSLLQQLLQSQRCLRLCIIVNPLKKRQLNLPFLGFSLPYALAPIYRSGRRQAHKLRQFYYTKPCAIIASATFTKPAILAPA